MTTAIWIVLALLGLWVAFLLIRDILKHKNVLETNSLAKTGFIGFVGNFFDTLGIGSFAIETALLKFSKQTEDKLIPGTLNVANAIPTVVQAIIFIQIVEVDPITLILMIVSAGVGAITGAQIVVKLPERKIQLVMGIALLIAAGFMTATNLKGIVGHGQAIGLEGKTLAFAVSVNFILGALMTAGIGLYAPCMVLVFALGLSPRVAFPIMMGSCAFLMPMASAKFIKEGAYNRKASLAITLAGALGVIVAAYLVKSMPMEVLRWVVILVIFYTSLIMLRSSRK